jgi:hypothetical protein
MFEVGVGSPRIRYMGGWLATRCFVVVGLGPKSPCCTSDGLLLCYILATFDCSLSGADVCKERVLV